MRISDWSSDVCSSDLAGGWAPEEHPDLPGQSDGHQCDRHAVRIPRRSSADARSLPRFVRYRYLYARGRAIEGDQREPLPQDRHFGEWHGDRRTCASSPQGRSEEHTSELQSLMRISYAVFCLKKKTTRSRT